jgi:hypothetical protein
MPRVRRIGDHHGRRVVVVTALLALAGVAFVLRGLTAPGPPPQPSRAAAAASTATSSASTPSASVPSAGPGSEATAPGSGGTASPQDGSLGPILRPSPPVSLSIPSIGVRTRGIVDLHLDPHGALEAPTDFDRAGWYADGPTPGEFGPAVIGAHVDSKDGPAVFYRLGALHQGASVVVTRKDGTVARFVVDKVARYAKSDFPTAVVYGDTKGRAELRLITCGGAFDRSTGHYVDNIVAFAHLVA